MTPSRDDVVWCYRLLLDREPESDEAVERHLAKPDRESVVRAFFECEEFRRRGAGSRPEAGLPFDLAPISVDAHASAGELGALIARIQASWQHLGLVRPHFSVLTAPEFLPEKFVDAQDAFWESGEHNIESVMRVLARHGFDDPASRTCVEFGCGVGRLSVPLSRRFRTVHAYDISPAHLEIGRARAKEVGASNIRFHVCSERVLSPLARGDFFCSFIVFQHNPPPVIRALVDNALRSLRAGGIAIFQVPTYIAGYGYSTAGYLRGEGVLDMEMHCLPQSEIFRLAAARGCEVLEVREDDWTGQRDVYLSNTFVIQRKPGLVARALRKLR